MKVVHLNSHLSWRGGEQQVLYLSQFLHAHSYDSVVVCPPHSALYQRAREANIPIRALRMRHELDLVSAWQLGRYLRQQRVDKLRHDGIVVADDPGEERFAGAELGDQVLAHFLVHVAAAHGAVGYGPSQVANGRNPCGSGHG